MADRTPIAWTDAIVWVEGDWAKRGGRLTEPQEQQDDGPDHQGDGRHTDHGQRRQVPAARLDFQMQRMFQFHGGPSAMKRPVSTEVKTGNAISLGPAQGRCINPMAARSCRHDAKLNNAPALASPAVPTPARPGAGS